VLIYPLLNLIRNQIIYLIGDDIIRRPSECRGAGICCRTIDSHPEGCCCVFASRCTKQILMLRPSEPSLRICSAGCASCLSTTAPLPAVDLRAQARRESELGLTLDQPEPVHRAMGRFARASNCSPITPSIFYSRGLLEQGRKSPALESICIKLSAGRWPFQAPSLRYILAPTARSRLNRPGRPRQGSRETRSNK